MRAFLRRLTERSSSSGPTIVTPSSEHPLLEFRSEQEPLVRAAPAEPSKPPTPPRPFKMDRAKPANAAMAVVIFALLLAASAGVIAYWLMQPVPPRVLVDNPGAAPVASGDAVPPEQAASSATNGRLDISSDPPGGAVIVDGRPRGRTPVVIDDLVPGPHQVAITANGATVTRTVTVGAGSTATVMASIVGTRPLVGWVAFETPFEAEVLERGRLLGTTASSRIALAPGPHDLELRNMGLGYRSTVGVQVVAGQTVRPGVKAPTGLVSINALPWAEVILDDKSIGTTPLANLPVPLGTHTVVLKHPTLGERRQTINVVGNTPVRVGVSFEP